MPLWKKAKAPGRASRYKARAPSHSRKRRESRSSCTSSHKTGCGDKAPGASLPSAPPVWGKARTSFDKSCPSFCPLPFLSILLVTFRPAVNICERSPLRSRTPVRQRHATPLLCPSVHRPSAAPATRLRPGGTSLREVVKNAPSLPDDRLLRSRRWPRQPERERPALARHGGRKEGYERRRSSTAIRSESFPLLIAAS